MNMFKMDKNQMRKAFINGVAQILRQMAAQTAAYKSAFQTTGFDILGTTDVDVVVRWDGKEVVIGWKYVFVDDKHAKQFYCDLIEATQGSKPAECYEGKEIPVESEETPKEQKT